MQQEVFNNVMGQLVYEANSVTFTIVIFAAEFWIAVHVSEDVGTGPPAGTLHAFTAHVEGVEAEHVKEFLVYLAENLVNLFFCRVKLKKR